MTDHRTRFLALAALVIAAAASRLLPHPPNFTAVGAIALFAGASFADRRAAFLVPLAGMLLSDLVIGLHRMLPLVYALVCVTVVLGVALRRHRGALPIAGAGFASALIFYLVTNAAVWAGGRLYPPTVDGLLASYVAALPFFGHALAANLFYSALLFGGWTLAERGFPALRTRGSPA